MLVDRPVSRPSSAPLSEESLIEAVEELTGELFLFQRAAARGLGLTPVQFIILQALLKKGPLRPSQIALEFGVSRAAVSAEINSLEGRGWVTRSRPETDRRRLRAALTGQARDGLARLRRRRRQVLVKSVRAVPSAERGRLTRHLLGMAGALRTARDGDRPLAGRSP